MSHFERPISNLLLLVTLALPFFFLPVTATRVGPDTFSKLHLLLFIGAVAAGVWLWPVVRGERLAGRSQPLWWAALGLVAVSAISALVSGEAVTGLFGAAPTAGLPVLGLAALVMLAVIAAGLGAPFFDRVPKWLFRLQLALVAIAAIWFSFAAWLGPVNAWVMAALGSPDDLAVMLAVLNSFLFASVTGPKLRATVLANGASARLATVALGVSWLLLLYINHPGAWWTAFAGLTAVNLFSSGDTKSAADGSRREGYKRLLKRLLLPALALAMIVFNYSAIESAQTARRFARVFTLDPAASLQVAKGVLAESPFFGQGPEQFPAAYSAKRSETMNTAPYWDYRMTRAGSAFADLAITTGVVGLLAMAALLAAIGRLLVQLWRRRSDTPVAAMIAGILFSGLAAFLLHPANLAVLWLWWLFAGYLAYASAGPALPVNAGPASRFLPMAAVMGLAVCLAILVVSARFWTAELIFDQGNASVAALGTAARLDPYQYRFETARAKRAREQAVAYLQAGDRRSAEEYINEAVAAGNRAIGIAPQSVAAQESLALTYRDIARFAPEATPFAVRYFAQAKALEPTNPVLWTELGKLYLDSNQKEQALEALAEAVRLKPDYPDARLFHGKALLAVERPQEAESTLLELKKYRADRDMYFELGRAYYNQRRFEMAIGAWQQVLAFSPLDLNALYSLGLAYEATGDNASARHYFEKALAIDPENEELKGKVGR